MYDRILFPTDGSDVARRARDHAIELAKRYDATLHALHVVSLDEVDEVPEHADRDLVEELRDEGEDVVQTAIEAAQDRGVSAVEEGLILGRPTETILEYADEHAVDLIVMGTHGRTGLSHYLMGSVAEKVVRHASCPVQAVPPADNE
ncbi:MAG: universal stress protein [Halodesulfurarchaeum sp.]